MKGELLKAITTLVFAIGENQRGSDALSVIANELDRLKERERMLIHTLNELHETICVGENKDIAIQHEDFIVAYKKADKVLEGN